MNLTSEQVEAIKQGHPIRVVPSEVGEECVMLRGDVYERMSHSPYDDSTPTDEESARLGWEAGQKIGWDTPEMSEYDDYDAHKP